MVQFCSFKIILILIMNTKIVFKQKNSRKWILYVFWFLTKPDLFYELFILWSKWQYMYLVH